MPIDSTNVLMRSANRDEKGRGRVAVTLRSSQSVSKQRVLRYRRALLAKHRVRTKRQALRFVDALGFCYAFTSGPGGFPGLFDVLATRSIDRMWSWAWRWKDELATERKLFYGKVLRRKPTYISLDYLPYFYALTDNVGDPDDYLQAYRAGALSMLAKDLYEYVRDGGACSTWTLRRHFVGSRGRSGAFHRALSDLQGSFLFAKVGESEGGSYCFIWDLFDRWFPTIHRRAAKISADDAAAAVLERCVQTLGAAPPGLLVSLFDLSPKLMETSRARLEGRIVDGELDGTSVLIHNALL